MITFRRVLQNVVRVLFILILTMPPASAAGSAEAEIKMLYTLQDPAPRLVFADAKGVEVKTVTGLSMDNVWSPEGDRVLLRFNGRNEDENDFLQILNVDGTFSAVRGLLPPYGFYNPVWSADGQRVLAVGMMEGVISVSITTDDASVVCPESKTFSIAAVYPSPNGEKFAASGHLLPASNDIRDHYCPVIS